MDNEVGSNTVELLLHSCASITRIARSNRTLSSTANKRRRCLEEDDAEKQRAGNFRAAVQSQEQGGSDNDNPIEREYTVAFSNSQGDQQLLQSKLLDESLRQRQEELLLSRIGMSQAAVAAAFVQQKQPPPANPAHDNGHEGQRHNSDSNNCNNYHHPRYVIIREATKNRNQQVHRMLQISRELDSVREEQWRLEEECRTWERRNRQVWNQIVDLPATQQNQVQQQQQLLAENLVESNNDSREEGGESSGGGIQDENTILSSVLADLILGSGIDWNNDKRLRQTLAKLG